MDAFCILRMDTGIYGVKVVEHGLEMTLRRQLGCGLSGISGQGFCQKPLAGVGRVAEPAYRLVQNLPCLSTEVRCRQGFILIGRNSILFPLTDPANVAGGLCFAIRDRTYQSEAVPDFERGSCLCGKGGRVAPTVADVYGDRASGRV